MPPSAIIDSDLDSHDNTILYVAELDAIWKATTLGGGSAVWSQVYDVANFDAALGSGLVIDRVRCAKLIRNVIYSIGHALGTDGVTYKEFCGRSANGGLTWNWYEIGEIENPGEGFTLGSVNLGNDNAWISVAFGGGGGQLTLTATVTSGSFPGTSTRIGLVLPDALPSSVLSLEYDVLGDSLSLGYDADGDLPALIDAQTYLPPVAGTFTAITGGYHFSGTLNVSRLADPSIIHVGWFNDARGRWAAGSPTTRVSTFCNLVIGGVEYSGGVSRAFDIAPGNWNWLYYGATNKIWMSEDGGVTWFEFYTAHGAHDICVDPQINGAVYYWSTDGNLNLLIHQANGAAGTLTTTGMMTEVPLNVPLRIARDLSSGRLLAIPNGTVLKMRNLGSVTDLKTGLGGATGLHCYAGQKAIFCDAGDIYISDDIQAVYPAAPTITAKKGGWAAYSGGINAHRIVSA